MGLTISSLNNIKSNEHLLKFSSNTSIPPSEPFWDEMFGFTFNKSIRTVLVYLCIHICNRFFIVMLILF